MFKVAQTEGAYRNLPWLTVAYRGLPWTYRGTTYRASEAMRPMLKTVTWGRDES